MVKVDEVKGEIKIRKDMVWYTKNGKQCKPPSKPKVYCDDCEWRCLSYSECGSDSEFCFYVKGYKDTPTCKEGIHANPSKDNKKNNCQYYKKRLNLWQRIFGNV